MTLDAATGRAATMQIQQAVEPANPHVFRYFQKDAQDFSRHARIAETAMPPGGRQPEMLGQQIEASSLERWNKASRHSQRAQERIAQSDSKNSTEFEVQK